MRSQFGHRFHERRRTRPHISLAARYVELRRVLRAAPNPYLVLKPDAPRFTIVEVTDSYLRATNTTRNAIIGRGLFEIRELEPGAAVIGDGPVRASLQHVLNTGASHAIPVQSFQSWRPDGHLEERFWAAINTPVLDDAQRVARIIHFMQDVTPVKRLALKRGEAERTAQLKSEFLARVSHELRTPLNAIDGYAQLLEMELNDSATAKQREYLTRIRHSEEQLLAMIDELLDQSRVEAGRMTFDMKSVSVAETLMSVEELIAPQLRANELNVEFLRPDVQLAVHGDPDKVRRIIVNLVSNAVKYTDRGGSVRVYCDDADDRVAIHVTDSGHGIARDQLERIFEPFVQVDNAGQQGFGLGLSICRELARGMGGDVQVSSQPLRGSTFTLLLNRYNAAHASGGELQTENAADD